MEKKDIKKDVKKKLVKKQESALPEFKIMASSDVSKGVYSNVAVIQHTQNEFMIDFLMKFGGDGQLVSRVILSPQHVISFIDALEKNIEKYESKFGKIKKNQKPKVPVH